MNQKQYKDYKNNKPDTKSPNKNKNKNQYKQSKDI
jgi:hypothetical protein